MRNLLFFSLLMVVAFTMTRCNKDDEKNDPVYSALGNVKISNDSTIIILDNDKRMLVKNIHELTAIPGNGIRVVVDFTIASETDPNVEYVIKIVNWSQILFKPVSKLTATNSDSLGTDPINISSVDIARNYLNVDFSFFAYNLVHSFSLARVMTDTRTDTITLEIRHNANQDNTSNLYNGIMTFDLSSLKSTTANSVVLDIRAKQYDNNSIYQGFFTYKY